MTPEGRAHCEVGSAVVVLSRFPDEKKTKKSDENQKIQRKTQRKPPENFRKAKDKKKKLVVGRKDCKRQKSKKMV